MIVALMAVPLRPMEAEVTTAGRRHPMEVVRTEVQCHPTAVVALPLVVVGCRPTAVAAVAAPMVGAVSAEVADMPPVAVVTAVGVSTAVAVVDTEVTANQTLNSFVTPSDFGRRFPCSIASLCTGGQSD